MQKKGPITVLDLRDSPWVDGPGRTILECAETIDPNRVRIIIGVTVPPGARAGVYGEEAMARGLCVELVPERCRVDFSVLAHLASVVDREKVDIIHSHDVRTDLYALLVGRWKRIKVVGTAHGWIANNLKSKCIAAFDRFILMRMDAVIAVSSKTLSRLGLGGRCSRVVIPNALRTELYRSKSKCRNFRQEHGYAPDDVLIGSIGRLSPEKGQDLLLYACKEVVQEFPSVKVLLVGKGPEEHRLRELAMELGIEDSVAFLGYIDDMPGVYLDLDVVVQSSYTEGMPNVILESLLLCVPVIATDVGGTSEIVENGVHGRLVPKGDRSALTKAVRDFLDQPELLKSMAAAGSERVVSEFDHASRIRRLTDFYEDILSHDRKIPE